MNRRAFLSDSSMATLALGFPTQLLRSTAKEERGSDGGGSDPTSQTISEPVLPGTAPLTLQGDLAAQMVEGIRRFLTPSGSVRWWLGCRRAFRRRRSSPGASRKTAAR